MIELGLEQLERDPAQAIPEEDGVTATRETVPAGVPAAPATSRRYGYVPSDESLRRLEAIAGQLGVDPAEVARRAVCLGLKVLEDRRALAIGPTEEQGQWRP